MVIVEERLASVERQCGEQRIMIDDLRKSIDRIDRALERIDERFNALDQKIDRRADVLDAKMSRMFVWMVGLQVTTFVSLASLLLSLILAR